MQRKCICIPDLLYKYSVCCPDVYHLSFPKFCDGPYEIVQYSCHVTLAVMILGMPSPPIHTFTQIQCLCEQSSSLPHYHRCVEHNDYGPSEYTGSLNVTKYQITCLTSTKYISLLMYTIFLHRCRKRRLLNLNCTHVQQKKRFQNLQYLPTLLCIELQHHLLQ